MIYINDDDPNFNWSKTAADNDWCSGSGTYSDPYIIENLYINANGYGGLLESGVDRLLSGLTTTEEVLRVTFTEDAGN